LRSKIKQVLASGAGNQDKEMYNQLFDFRTKGLEKKKILEKLKERKELYERERNITYY